MTLSDIANLRLISQQIAATKSETVKDLLGWMGAMQAQDYPMAKWAVGIRLPKSKDKTIEDALDKGEIIRTHVLRPTWHFVSAEDVYWMIELTSPHIKSSLKSSDRKLGLTETMYSKSNRIIEKALAPDRHVTREELIRNLTRAKIPTNNNRAWRFFLRAELDGIICSGATRPTKSFGRGRGKKQTYALLEKRVPRKKTFGREESLSQLARKYFTSHAPATVHDFAWWSGLSMTDARDALEMIQSDFVSEKINSGTYWLPNSFSFNKSHGSSVYLLPAYDEFIIGYRDRSAALNPVYQKKSVSENGLFRPVIVINGQVSGLWKKTVSKNSIVVETHFFRPHSKKEKQSINNAVAAFGDFIGEGLETITI
jgi:hypothetical protein